MRRIGPWVLVIALVVVAALLVAPGCSRKAAPPPEPPTRPVETTPTPPPPPPPAPEVEQPREMQMQDVFFDYDKSNIRDDQRAALDNNGRQLRDNANVNVILEGHCDERGTVEYNLALGERRAQSAKNYLVEFGVDGGRLQTISYGEERPFVQGTGEEAWAANRRVHFVVQR